MGAADSPSPHCADPDAVTQPSQYSCESALSARRAACGRLTARKSLQPGISSRSQPRTRDPDESALRQRPVRTPPSTAMPGAPPSPKDVSETELDHLLDAERPAQPRDLGLQGVGGARGRLVAVRAADQPLGGHAPPRVEEE